MLSMVFLLSLSQTYVPTKVGGQEGCFSVFIQSFMQTNIASLSRVINSEKYHRLQFLSGRMEGRETVFLTNISFVGILRSPT